MKFLRIGWFLLSGILVITPFQALAARMYVTDELRLTVRSQPDIRSDVLTVIESGEAVEVLAESDAWANIQLGDDTEGWVQKRYLTSQETAGRKLARLQSLHTTTTKQNAELLKENKALQKDVKELRQKLAQQREKSQELEAAYTSLKTESADFLALKAEHQKAQSTLTAQSRKLSTLESKVARLQTRQTLYWFLGGAGVLVLGFIIGFSAKRQRRKPLLLQ